MTLMLASGMAAEWPQFRGPGGLGISETSPKLPVSIGPGKNVVWKTAVPPGHSSPVVWGNRIFITAAEGGSRAAAPLNKVVDRDAKLYTICLDRTTGKELWRREAPRPRVESYQPTNSPASPSPVTDGKLVYVFFGDFGVLAYDMDGKEVWRIPLGPFNNANGHGSSPMLVDDLVVLLCDQDTNSYLLAVDKATGKTRWKVERPEVTRGYSTPVVARPAKGPAELIVPGAYTLTAYAVDSGKKLWWINGLSWQPKGVPIVDGDMIYANWWETGGDFETPVHTPDWAETSARFDTDKDGRITGAEFAPDPRLQRNLPNNDLNGDGAMDEREWNFYRVKRGGKNTLLAVRAGGQGDITNSDRILWRVHKFLPNVPSPLLYRGVLYIIKDGGIFTALEPRTGEVLKQGRLQGALDTYYASPVGGAGHIYVLSQTGKLTVIRAGRDWEIVSTTDFEDEAFATPAIVGNSIYLRTRTALYCFREGGK